MASLSNLGHQCVVLRHLRPKNLRPWGLEPLAVGALSSIDNKFRTQECSALTKNEKKKMLQ